MRHSFNCSAKTVFKRISTKPEEFRRTLSYFTLKSHPFFGFPEINLVFDVWGYLSVFTQTSTGALSATLSPYQLGHMPKASLPQAPRGSGRAPGTQRDAQDPLSGHNLVLSAAPRVRVQVHRLDTWCDTHGGKGLLGCGIYCLLVGG